MVGAVEGWLQTVNSGEPYSIGEGKEWEPENSGLKICYERYTEEAGNTILWQKLTQECNGDQVDSVGKDHKPL